MQKSIYGIFAILALTTWALRYEEDSVQYNLNQNQSATNPADYYGKWDDHEFFPSPGNWRFPFYTLFLDRFVNGDPTNDNINGTAFEHDLNSNQMRHGGDAAGFNDSLDYLQGMGIKGIYLAGTILLNLPWTADGYSPVDLTLLDAHYGDIEIWREVIQEVHRRGMYVVMDNTLATMSDLIGFEGHLNETTPFSLQEYKVRWKNERRYLDFEFGNNYNETCDYPRFWLETGYRVDSDVTSQLVGCYDSDFDQYGDTEAFGVFPDWQRQLSKFASVQDRLREWVPSVRDKIKRHSCLMILMLDIDGFRYDKATQATVDAQAEMSQYYRDCARSVGKDNFFIPGEITGGDTFGAIYMGRGRQPDMRPENVSVAIQLTNTSSEKYFIRSEDRAALDAGAFHYSVYRSLTRFLGMDGNLAAGYDVPVPWVDAWNTMLVTNDFVNANTGKFDPRHMFGATNQDVFRWPAIKDGTKRLLLGLFITTLHLPGIPKLIWGEEQAFYILDSTAANYIFGRQAMTSATAWQTHGCFAMNSTQYYQFPLESARDGCNDDTQGYDHRDPSHPIRNILKSMYQMRENYPVLNDGFLLQVLSNQTRDILYPGSEGTATETGMWSVLRSQYDSIQDLSGSGHGNQSVWLVYQNDNSTITYEFDCTDNDTALIAPFATGTVVKNLFYPYDELTLKSSSVKLNIGGSEDYNGCLDSLTLEPYGFAAYVPESEFQRPRPMITSFSPGHDARIQSTVGISESETVEIEIEFSEEMDCDSVTDSISLTSRTDANSVPTVNRGSTECTTLTSTSQTLNGQIMPKWKWSATLDGVYNGIHRLTVNNATSATGSWTNAIDHFMFRVGQQDNPLVFTRSANYSDSLFHRNKSDDSLYIMHRAPGADRFRYSTNWGSSWSGWLTYDGQNTTISLQDWSGTSLQDWKGKHVIVEYWDRISGSSAYVQHGDLDYDGPRRRYPHFYWNGPYNQYGYDRGLENHFTQESDTGLWKFRFMADWPAVAQFNVWGMNPDGKPDQTYVLGDIDGDSVLDRIAPSSLQDNIVNITEHPARPHLAWNVFLNDGSLKFELKPTGNEVDQIALFVLLWTVPLFTAITAVWAFKKSFYQVKFNRSGINEKGNIFLAAAQYAKSKIRPRPEVSEGFSLLKSTGKSTNRRSLFHVKTNNMTPQRRTVLIATMEYDIEDWGIKIKIGGLGVMAQLMGKHLGHQDLIWVVPCIGEVDYPEVEGELAEPMSVTILGNQYEVQIRYHRLRNITYVLLDAPVFRQQTKAEPYPARMDDLDSAIYYSAWNQCIALAIKRFPNIDLYHINDYHGSLAPLYLLPQSSIPVCLSLHNAEFQGLWPLRTATEKEELAAIFNLDLELVTKYVQFGDVFNLLHAGASYLRLHQQGFGAVGVSKKYGKRSHLRYPIFWGLRKIGKLPNPDPSDTDTAMEAPGNPGQVDPAYEAGRAELRRKAQEWAGLGVDGNADLCVFVGRWSMQKGVDLIADVFPDILDRHPNVQLICIGPVIDLYGKFAALKLAKLMELYPKRVFSKPEFTALPPYIFSGAEFALIPSRDEPFGLVAVEFGRKGALGVGARVGGLGQMPGWWYTVESTTTNHLLQQFKSAIDTALSSKNHTRAVMRAHSARQRFPVAMWVENLELLQSAAIRLHRKHQARSHSVGVSVTSSLSQKLALNSSHESLSSPGISESREISVNIDPSSISTFSDHVDLSSGLGRKLSLGVRSGPGHRQISDRRVLGRDGINQDRDNLAVEDIVTDYLDESSDDERILSEAEARTTYQMRLAHEHSALNRPSQSPDLLPPIGIGQTQDSRDSFLSPSPSVDSFLLPPRPISENQNRYSSASTLSLDTIVGERKDFKLQQVDPNFTDKTGVYFREFEEKLASLNADNSETALCIETYLEKAEKKWFTRFRDARLGRQNRKGYSTPNGSQYDSDRRDDESYDTADEFLLGPDYVPPTGLKRWMQLRLKDWPVYSFFLAFGQVIAANSYQVTLLSGEVGQTASKLYTVASIYLIFSIIWWMTFRWFKAIFSLSIPFFFYGLAFILIGVAGHYTDDTRGWIQNVATGFYSAASSSGSIFFALNFGDEGGAPVKEWVFRASAIQGIQQLYVVALWYWGSYLSEQTSAGVVTKQLLDKWVLL
ncbi:putative alpha-glucan synthase [Phaeomoniella chlamydospora]|uniref:alpha-1,3-glucan synthase n=1 Tax=Phaeomoniella chlamydospora TaxID=158046 RepID=A0A0G2EPB1_PHACM|nr:putative alpha-glucan synthase [Phaeomoniella chlamydospora]